MASRAVKEARLKAALRRERERHLFITLFPLFDAWFYGLQPGGGRINSTVYPELEMPEKYKAAALSRVKACRGAQLALSDELLSLPEIRSIPACVYNSARERIDVVESAVNRYVPEPDRSRTNGLRVVTYVYYTALFNLCSLTEEKRGVVLNMLSVLGSFADWLIPWNSRLVESVNDCWYDCRNALLSETEWPEPCWLIHPRYNGRPEEKLPYWLRQDLPRQKELLRRWKNGRYPCPGNHTVKIYQSDGEEEQVEQVEQVEL